jgi:hypothetical protein
LPSLSTDSAQSLYEAFTGATDPNPTIVTGFANVQTHGPYNLAVGEKAKIVVAYVGGTGAQAIARPGQPAYAIDIQSFTIKDIPLPEDERLRRLKLGEAAVVDHLKAAQFSPPINFNFGMTMEVYGEKGDPNYLILAVETITATDYGQRWNFGGELWFGTMLALGGGYKLNYNVEDYCLGLGLKYPFGERDIRVDVSYRDGSANFDAPIRIALSGSF